MLRPPRLARLGMIAAAFGTIFEASAAHAADPPSPSPQDIFSPLTAPVIVLHIGIHRRPMSVAVPQVGTSIGATTIEHDPNATSFTNIVVQHVPGAASAPSGEFHVRGSHGQYTYYLDGAPLPASVSGSFSDLINPKNIQSLRVYTGGFPASYGGNLAAVFDVTAKAGDAGAPHGFAQQLVQGYSTYESTLQAGGGEKRFTYFLSGVRSFTGRRLDPLTEDPIHDAGNDTVLFGKLDYQAGKGDKLIFETDQDGAFIQLPNTPDRQAFGQNDTQRENGHFANFIWRHSYSPPAPNSGGGLSTSGAPVSTPSIPPTKAAPSGALPGTQNLTVAFYSHTSELRYFPSAADLVGATADSPLTTASENRTSSYLGLRVDYNVQLRGRHNLGFGTDNETVYGHEHFDLSNSDGTTVTNVVDDQDISGNDRSVYVQDDWSPGHWLIDFGARYDIHKTDTLTNQVSPRFNAYYDLSKYDKLHAFYDRLFQPAPVEDIRKLDAATAPFRPERDTLYEVGWERKKAGYTTSVSGYYKTEQDVIDENVIEGTQITEPFNVQKGYVRGLEFAFDGLLGKSMNVYANYARSWAKAAGDFTGGFVPIGASSGYFYDDHDQTDTVSSGFSYDRNGTSLDLDDDYGSGFPYGSDAAGDVNFLRVPPHLIFNFGAGFKLGSSELSLIVINLLNHPYIIKQAGVFTDTEWGQDRTFGAKYTLNF